MVCDAHFTLLRQGLSEEFLDIGLTGSGYHFQEGGYPESFQISIRFWVDIWTECENIRKLSGYQAEEG
jgi:hypothetical protein